MVGSPLSRSYGASLLIISLFAITLMCHPVSGLPSNGSIIGISEQGEAEGTVTVPSQPRNLTFDPSKGTMMMRWEAPLSDGNMPITEYRIYRTFTVGYALELMGSVNATTYTYTDLSIVKGYNYDYTITAVNGMGESDFSEYIYAALITLPGPPTGLNAENHNGIAYLTWWLPLDDGGLSVQTYNIYRWKNADMSDLAVSTVGVGCAYYPDPGLEPGYYYNYSVTAITSWGEGPSCEVVNVLLLTTPGVPSSLYSDSIHGGVSLTWQPPAMQGPFTASHYCIYRLDEGSSFRCIAEVDGKVTKYVDSDVQTGHWYQYAISARNEAGEGEKTYVYNATPLAPPLPPNVIALEPSENAVDIRWTPPLCDGGRDIIEYRIYRSINNGPSTYLASTDGDASHYLDLNIAPLTDYYYCVEAVTSYGSGTSPLMGPSHGIFPADISIQIGPCTSDVGILVTISGQVIIETTGVPVREALIYIHYSNDHGISWHALTAQYSDEQGYYSFQWIPTATGQYLLKASLGLNDYLMPEENTVSMGVARATGNEVFSVQSNSILSALNFNSVTKELTFTVSGDSGTSGHTRVMISKQLVENGTDVLLSFDGAPIHYNLSSHDTYWVLEFNYSHSSHQIGVILPASSVDTIPPENTSPAEEASSLMFGVLFLAVAGCMLMFVLARYSSNNKK